MDKSRKQFEVWYKSKYLFRGYEFDKLENGSYQWVESMWQAWQASRAAVEVKLPGWFYDAHKDKCLDLDDTVRCLNDHGLKVKQ